MKLLLTLTLMLLAGFAGAQEYLKMGDECYNKKDYECAYINYMKGYEAKLNATKNVLYYRIGYCLYAVKKYKEAKPWFLRAIAEKNELNPTWDLASAMYSTGSYDSAAMYYSSAYNLATDKESKRNIAYWAATSYNAKAKYAEAKKMIEEAVKQDSTYASTFLLMGSTGLKMKDYTMAETGYRKALRVAKDSLAIASSYRGLGEVHYSQEEYEDAIPYYRNGLIYSPNDEDLTTFIADSYRNDYLSDSADFYYRKAIAIIAAYPKPTTYDSMHIGNLLTDMIYGRLDTKDTVKAMLSIPQLLQYCPQCGDVPSFLDAMIAKKDIKIIEPNLTKYIAFMKNYKGTSLKRDASYYYTKLGDLYRESGQQQKALASYNQALAVNPTSEEVKLSMIRMLMADKKYKAAIDSINSQLTRVFGSDARSKFIALRSEVQYQLKDTAAAGAGFREVVKASPYNFMANYYLGLMALQRKDSATCTPYWEKAAPSASIAGISKEMALPLYRYMGMIYYARNTATNYSLAITYLERALAIDSSLPVNRLYAGMAHVMTSKFPAGKTHMLKLITQYQKKKDTLAMVYRTLGYIEMKGMGGPKYPSAISYYEEAAKNDPKDSSTASDLGTVYYQQKNYSKAAESFGKYTDLVKNLSNKAVGYYNQALSYYMNKEKENAKTYNDKSLALFPNYADAKKLKAEIDKPN